MRQTAAFLLPLLLLFACQKGKDPVEPPQQLKVDNTSLSLNGTAGTVDSFTVQYNGKWNITLKPSTITWFKLSTLTGTGNTKVYVTVQESNSSGVNKTATLTVTPEGSTAQGTNITVTQRVYEFTAWRNVYGGSEDDEFLAAVPVPGGGYVAVGYTKSTNGDVSLNHGKKDLWVVKVGVEGNKVWQKTYGGSEDDVGNAITATPEGGYLIAAETFSTDGDVNGNHGQIDAWLVKIDADGNKIWQKTYGGSSSEQAFSLTSTIDGGYVVGGITTSNDGDVSGLHGQSDAWLFKIDANGNKLWQKTYGGTNGEMAMSVTKTSDGGYIALGYSTAFLADGDVVPTHGFLDYWAFKVDASGNLKWQKAFGGSDVEFAWSVVTTSDGGFVLAGYTRSTDGDVISNHGRQDAWIVKLDGNGNKLWQKALGGSGDDEAYSIIPVSGGYLVAGRTTSTNGDVSGQHGLDDAWVLKLDNNGSMIWQKTYGGSDLDGASSIVAAGNGTYLVAGLAKSTDGDIVGPHGKQDAWLISFKDQ